MYKKYFWKRRINSISQVEYFSGSSLVRVSNQFAIEKVIMTKNSSRFILACSSPLLNQPLLGRLGMCGKKTDAQRLLHETASIDAGELSKIHSLFHRIMIYKFHLLSLLMTGYLIGKVLKKLRRRQFLGSTSAITKFKLLILFWLLFAAL